MRHLGTYQTLAVETVGVTTEAPGTVSTEGEPAVPPRHSVEAVVQGRVLTGHRTRPIGVIWGQVRSDLVKHIKK